MGLAGEKAVGGPDVFELQGGLAIRLRPLQRLAPVEPIHDGDGQQIHPAAAVGKLVGVGRQQVAVEREAQELVVEPDGVVADAGRLRTVQLSVDLPQAFDLAAAPAGLRPQAVDQEGRWRRDHVRAQADRRRESFEFVQIAIGADGGEFQHLIEGLVQARGLDVVKQVGPGHERLFATLGRLLSRGK